MLDKLIQDIRYGARRLLKSPTVTLVAVITLALGIGASTAIFSVVDAALLRALPYEEPETLVHFWRTQDGQPSQHGDTSYPNFADWETDLRSFDDLAAYAGRTLTVTDADGAERISGGRVTADFFRLLGVRPMLGRDFAEDDAVQGGGFVTLLDHAYWLSRYGGDAGVVGRRLTMNGTDYTVIGVLPPEFHFAPHGSRQVWIPLIPSEGERSRRDLRFLKVVGRLAPRATLAQAQAESDGLNARLEAAYPGALRGHGAFLERIHPHIVGPVRPVLLILLGAVGFILLITCANVANLLLGRAAEREEEMSIRAALGAGRARLVRQVLVESMLLALIGGGGGLFIAYWGVELLTSALPGFLSASMPYLEGVGVNRAVLAFTMTISVGAGLLFGLVPALQASQVNLANALKEGGRSAVGSSRQRLRHALIAGEVAVSLVLLVGAGLLIQSAARLLRVDPGFNTENLLSLEVFLPPSQYETAEQVNGFYSDLLRGVQAIPGVAGAATVNKVPVYSTGNTISLIVEDNPAPPGEEPEANLRLVSASYFDVMEIPLLQGRAFDERDVFGGDPVMVINEGFARDLFTDRNPIGQRTAFVVAPETSFEVVGVVEDVKLDAMDQAAASVIYVSARQSPGLRASLVVRATHDPASLVGVVRNEVRALESLAAISQIATMDEIIGTSQAVILRRYPARLLGGFAGLALLLVAIGLYGVISYSVTRRTREIGIRVALGARPSGVVRQLVREGLGVTGLGLVMGMAGALALTRFLESMLYGVQPIDMVTILGAATVLAGVALLATYLPSRRAARVDPMIALRYE